MQERGILKIIGYQIVFYNKNKEVINTISRNIESSLNFGETLNNGQGVFNFDIHLDINEYNLLNDLYGCEIYVIVDYDDRSTSEVKLLYSGILNRKTKETINNVFKLSLSFIGLYSLLTRTMLYDIPSSGIIEGKKNYDFIYNGKDFDLLIKGIQQFKATSIKIRETSLKDVYNKKVIGKQSNASGTLLYIQKETETALINEIGICDIEGKFINGETIDILNDNNSIYGSIIIEDNKIIYNPYDYFIKTYPPTNNKFNYKGLKDIPGKDINYECKNKILNKVIEDIFNTREELSYFFGKEGYFIVKDKLDEYKQLTYGFDVFKIETESEYNLKNYILCTNGNTEVIIKDDDSIEEYGLFIDRIEKKEFSNIEDLKKYGRKLLIKKPKQQITISCDVNKHLRKFIAKKWHGMKNKMNTYTTNWQDLFDEVGGQSVFDIEVGDIINIVNIDYDNELSNLVCVRKEFNGDSINFYLDGYFKNKFI